MQNKELGFAVLNQTCAKQRASIYSSQLSFCFKWATFVKNQEIVQNSARNCKFTKMGLLDQKRADVLKFAIFVQNSVHNNEMLESGVFCVKRTTKQQPDKIFLQFYLKLV